MLKLQQKDFLQLRILWVLMNWRYLITFQILNEKGRSNQTWGDFEKFVSKAALDGSFSYSETINFFISETEFDIFRSMDKKIKIVIIKSWIFEKPVKKASLQQTIFFYVLMIWIIFLNQSVIFLKRLIKQKWNWFHFICSNQKYITNNAITTNVLHLSQKQSSI